MRIPGGRYLKSGDECLVRVSDENGIDQTVWHRAIYKSENAKEMAWEYELLDLNIEGEVSILEVRIPRSQS